MTVRELLSKADSLELAEWMAYSNIQHKKEKRREMEAKAIRGANDMRSKIRSNGNRRNA